MNAREPVELSKVYLLLNHDPVTLVSSADGGRRNVMAASRAMPPGLQPPKVAFIIDRRTPIRELLAAGGSLFATGEAFET